MTNQQLGTAIIGGYIIGGILGIAETTGALVFLVAITTACLSIWGAIRLINN